MKITLSHNIFVHEPHFTFDTFLIIGNSLDFPIKWLLENPIDKYYDKIFAEHERINEISKTNVILTSFYMQHFRIDIDDYKDSSEFSVTTNHCKIVSIRWFRNPNSSNDLVIFFRKMAIFNLSALFDEWFVSTVNLGDLYVERRAIEAPWWALPMAASSSLCSKLPGKPFLKREHWFSWSFQILKSLSSSNSTIVSKLTKVL